MRHPNGFYRISLLCSKHITLKKNKKGCLIVLDGWGFGPIPERSAIHQAKTPVFRDLWLKNPHCTLTTHGESVGLPEGQMGNSEVGHMHIGAGRVIYQDLVKINKAIEEHTLDNNPVIRDIEDYAQSNHKPIHLLGLVSNGGVHSHINHLLGLIDILDAAGVPQIYIHAFLDGRDTDPNSGIGFIRQLQEHIKGRPNIQIATLSGRYYAMDRDKRWERIKKAYDAIAHGKGILARDPVEAIEERYKQDETDEFIHPIVLTDASGHPVGPIKPGDAAIFFNFRTDRPRELTYVLTQQDMPEYDMKKLDIKMATFANYDETFRDIKVVFPKENLSDTLGEVVSRDGKTQLRIAETEKYPHVTFFFSGGREEVFPGEQRIMVPSPKVATYDLQPEMSAFEVRDNVLSELETTAPDFIMLNFANTDMVGHTGNFEAAIKAAEAVDKCLGSIVPKALEKGYFVIITADHGNADYMINDDGSPHTAHTLNPVPCILVARHGRCITPEGGFLTDLAPTILHLMDLPIPKAMTGKVIFEIPESSAT